MSKTLNFEYTAKNVYFNPDQMLEDDPDRIKVVEVLRLLEQAVRRPRNGPRLHQEALQALAPLKLEIMAATSGRFLLPATVELTSQNSDLVLDAVYGQLRMSYSVRFSVPVSDDFTEDMYEQFEEDGGFQHLGLDIAKDGFSTDDGRAALSWSIDLAINT